MTPPITSRISASFPLIGVLLLAWAGVASHGSATAEILSVAASDDEITLRVDTGDGDLRVYALEAFEDKANADPVFIGRANDGFIRLHRQPEGRDLLFSRFQVELADGSRSTPKWAADLSEVSRNTHALPWPEEIKGVSNPESLDDLTALGVKHVHVNLVLGNLLLPTNAPANTPAIELKTSRQTLRLDPKAVKAWDKELTELTEADVNTIVVVLNRIRRADRPVDPRLLHPDTNAADAPHALGAFNLSTADGVDTYTALLGFVAERYTQPGFPHGRIGGLIVGNEVDSHWVWHNLGPANLDKIASHYIDALRLAWLAVRQHHDTLPVFASLTHSWSRPNSRQADKNVAGRELFDKLVQLGSDGGNFDWHLAYHPYPQNLFKPEFWNDRTAMFGMDSPMITFKNLEVLAEYMRLPANMVDGKPRRLILSEQGFHTPDGPDGEKIQAAAIALAYHRMTKIPQIEAFIMHRHVDNRNEGGLRLGVREPTADDGTLGRKKQSWQTFAKLGQPNWRESQRFALKVAGYDSWSQADPQAGPFPETSREWGEVKQHENVIFSLLDNAGEAKIENALAFSSRIIELPDGGMTEGLMLHPLAAGKPAATATFVVKLPAKGPAALVFKTHLAKPESTGAIFRVRVDGRKVFDQPVRDQAMRESRVDLRRYAGKTIKLTLKVAPGKTNSYDEAVWINPAIVAEP